MTEIKRLLVHIRGVRPLLMHNGQLVDPLSPASKYLKALTSKQKKNDDEYLEQARREFVGALYMGEQGPVITSSMLDGMMRDGAKAAKNGKAFLSVVSVPSDEYPLLFDGPKTADELWAAQKFTDRRRVGIGQKAIIRCRPIFNQWELKFEVDLFPSKLNVADVRAAIVQAGAFCGIGDYRPKFGRFVLVSLKEAKD